MSEDSDYTSDINYPLRDQYNQSAHQFRSEHPYGPGRQDSRDSRDLDSDQYYSSREYYQDSFDRETSFDQEYITPPYERDDQFGSDPSYRDADDHFPPTPVNEIAPNHRDYPPDERGYPPDDRRYHPADGMYPPDDRHMYPTPDDRGSHPDRHYPVDDRGYPPDNRIYPPDDRIYPPDERAPYRDDHIAPNDYPARDGAPDDRRYMPEDRMYQDDRRYSEDPMYDRRDYPRDDQDYISDDPYYDQYSLDSQGSQDLRRTESYKNRSGSGYRDNRMYDDEQDSQVSSQTDRYNPARDSYNYNDSMLDNRMAGEDRYDGRGQRDYRRDGFDVYEDGGYDQDPDYYMYDREPFQHGRSDTDSEPLYYNSRPNSRPQSFMTDR